MGAITPAKVSFFTQSELLSAFSPFKQSQPNFFFYLFDIDK